jgi:hypothetical protein
MSDRIDENEVLEDKNEVESAKKIVSPATIDEIYKSRFDKFLKKKQDVVSLANKAVEHSNNELFDDASKEQIEHYNRILGYLDDDKKELLKILSLEKMTNKMKRHNEYPPKISAWHWGISGSAFITVGIAVSLAFSFYMGGPYVETWPSDLILTLNVRVPASIPSRTIVYFKNVPSTKPLFVASTGAS